GQTLRLLRVFRNGPKVLLRRSDQGLTNGDGPRGLRPAVSPDVPRHSVRGAQPTQAHRVRHKLDFGPINGRRASHETRLTSRAPAVSRRRAAGCDQSRIAGRTTETYARGALGPWGPGCGGEVSPWRSCLGCRVKLSPVSPSRRSRRRAARASR